MNYQLNLEGLICPIPVLKTQAQLKKMQAGDVLEICCTDPQTQKDIPSLCNARGYQLLDRDIQDEKYLYRIQV